LKLATLKAQGRDGRLGLVHRDLSSAVWADDPYSTLQSALDHWDDAQGLLRAKYDLLLAGRADGTFAFDAKMAAAPLPRSYQWLDGSAFHSHGELMARVFKIDPPNSDRPLMYQGMSHEFLGPLDDVVLPSEADGIDFEGEFGIITDTVPMGADAREAEAHVQLIVQINDWSLRALGPVEMKTGFGWVQAKPACSVAPVAVTPDELGPAWQSGRVALPLHVWWNNQHFGAANGLAMGFSFFELVAHAARTRALCAGTIVGSGTVSNADYREIGSSCIAERRAIELMDLGESKTAYMRFGDTVRMAATVVSGDMPFGMIDQRVVEYRPKGR
jgi:2-keto-4-pentenoate hydratase/2-oxohepta-3-ene-1,7-dioic acid hydratase in catechol pathway